VNQRASVVLFLVLAGFLPNVEALWGWGRVFAWNGRGGWLGNWGIDGGFCERRGNDDETMNLLMTC
jgi:hypothetical protein